jgi:probable F420-dependent oxidoreductase
MPRRHWKVSRRPARFDRKPRISGVAAVSYDLRVTDLLNEETTSMQATRPFRFGVINETPLPRDAWIAHVQRIEALGYDTFLIRDHFVPDFFGPQFAPIAALATAAAVTTRLRVGTMVIDNDFRHPVVLAKEFATLDHLSGGRVELGIGAGWLCAEYDAAGMQYDRAGTRIDRMEEALAVIKGLFADGAYSFEGEHYVIRDLDSYPKPTQRPRPPILIGGGKPRVLRLAGREADIVGILSTSVASGTVENAPDERRAATVHEKLGWIREGAGDRYSEIELSLIPTLIPSADRHASADALIASNGWTGITPEDVLSMPSILIGTPDEMAETMLARRAEFGFTYYVVSDTEKEVFAEVAARLRESS